MRNRWKRIVLAAAAGPAGKETAAENQKPAFSTEFLEKLRFGVEAEFKVEKHG